MHVEQKRLRRIWICEGRPRGNDHPSYVEYKTAKYLFAKSLKNYASAYEQNQFRDISLTKDLNIRQFWKYIRNGRRARGGLTVINDGDIKYDTPEGQLDMWKAHFVTVLNETDDEAEVYDNDFKIYIEDIVKNLVNGMDKFRKPTHVNLDKFDVAEVDLICRSLPNGKAPGVDCITYEHIKFGGPTLVEGITKLFNGIIDYVHIPPHFKEGLLIALHKGHGKSKDSKDSYRGVTLLPAINKVFEKCIMMRLKPHLEEIHFPPPLQQASRRNTSNVMTSFVVNESIYNITENGGKVFTCMMDIEKCFDKLWWTGLLYKMYKLGIDNQLWFLMYDWLHGSRCRVLANGLVSEPFAITRSIKQGGILSMLNLCIFMYDIHEAIDEYYNNGLYCGDLYVGSICYADDVILMSTTKAGLDTMMDNAAIFACKWRFNFSITKTKCVVFGETKIANAKAMATRSFHLGTNTIEEVTHYTHLGVTLCAYDCSSERTKAACLKSTKTMASLNSVGARGNALFPFVCAYLWNRICIPVVLHGCELWYGLTKYELDLLERTQCRTFRAFQQLPQRTHNATTRGLLGEFAMISRMRLIKLTFLQRLISSEPSSLVKRIFIQRLYRGVLNQSMKGYIPDILEVLNACNLKEYFMEYVHGGRFPVKHTWKSMASHAVAKLDISVNEMSLARKADSARCIRLMCQGEKMVMHRFYSMIQRGVDKQYLASLFTMIRILALPSTSYEEPICKLCHKCYDDLVCHIIAECPQLSDERNILWDYILDNMDVHRSVAISCMEDWKFVDILLGGNWTGFNDMDVVDVDSFYNNISVILTEHFNIGLKLNYEWMR
jgi:sorting nexin-29